MWDTIADALNTTEIGASMGSAPEWVKLIPAGVIIGRDGRKWVNSVPDAILRAFQSNGADLPVDIEHSTEFKAPNGDPAPAVGWVRALEIKAGAIWGRVAWNRNGIQLIVTQQYRYLSPVIIYEKSTGIIAAMTSVALTNRPNMHLGALNSQPAIGGQLAKVLSDDERKICRLMGVPEDEFVQSKIRETGGNKLPC